MPDGTEQGARFSFGQIAAAAQPTRFALLSIAKPEWFSASDAAKIIGVARGTVREHTAILEALDLLYRQELRDSPHGTRLWRVTDTGAALRAHLASLIGQTPPPAWESRPPSALLAVGGDEDVSRIVARLDEAGSRVASVPGFWVRRRA